jgi:hypothetical protein
MLQQLEELLDAYANQQASLNQDSNGKILGRPTQYFIELSE